MIVPYMWWLKGLGDIQYNGRNRKERGGEGKEDGKKEERRMVK